MSFIADSGSGQPNPAAGVLGAAEAAVNAVNAGVSQQSLDQAKQAAQGLKDAATSGKFRIGENAFNDLATWIVETKSNLATTQRGLFLDRPPQLGSSQYAQTVSSHVQQGGAGPTNSASAIIRQLIDVLDITADALTQAKKNYQENEHDTTRAVK
jgi:hypothetical protein